MLPKNRTTRHESRRRPQWSLSPAAFGLEALESRQLLTYSPLGSPPDLVVTGETGAIAAYGGPISVALDVSNIGASSLIEPLAHCSWSHEHGRRAAQQCRRLSLAWVRGHIGSRGVVKLGDISIPSVPQNSMIEVSGTLTMPSTPPPKYPGDGGIVYIFFRADDLRQVADGDRHNNISRPVPVQVAAALPDLAAIAIDVPQRMQPGDVIAPTIKIANYGTVNTNLQAPITVLLVASTDQNFGPTDIIVGKYVIESLPGLSQAPSARTVLGDVNLDDPPNVATIDTTTDGDRTVTLPSSGTGYFLGLIVDPLNEIRELHEIGVGPDSSLKLVSSVTPLNGLPPAGTLSDPAPVSNVFPYPAYAPLTNLAAFADPTTLNQTLFGTGGGTTADGTIVNEFNMTGSTTGNKSGSSASSAKKTS